jgi:hypothetical protein
MSAARMFVTASATARRPFAHGHGFARVAEVVGDRHGDIRHRHLPRTDHLVAADHAADRAIANRNQEGLVGYRRKFQQTIRGFAHVDACKHQRRLRLVHAVHVAQHLRRLAQQDFQRHVDRARAILPVFEDQHATVVDLAYHRERAPLAPRDGREVLELRRIDHEHVTLLRLVAPQLHGRHAGLVVRNRRHVDHRSAAVGVRHGFGNGIRQAAGTHVVDQQDRVQTPARGAAIDDFLRATLDLRVATLHRGVIQVRARRAAAHGRSRAAAESDQHRGSAEDDDLRAHRDRALLDVVAAHVAESARDHDGLVIAA